MQGRLTFYHNPLGHRPLDEVGANFSTVLISFKAGDNRKPEFLAVKPVGKIPAIVLTDGTVITETPAIIAWLADA